MKKIITIIVLLFVAPLSVFANTTLTSVDESSQKNKIILTVGIEEVGYYPYNFEQNGKRVGFTIDVLDYIEANSNYDFEFIMLPWPRALHLVSEGKVDLILTLFKNPKREKTYHFIEPSYGYEASQLFTLMDKKVEFDGQLEQLAPFSIGTIREYSYGETFDQASYLTKLPALTEEILLKLLLGGRVDMAISNPLTFNELIVKQSASSKVRAIEPYVEITPVFMALTKKRKDSEQIKIALGKLTKQLKSTPYYQELLDKYQLKFK